MDSLRRLSGMDSAYRRYRHTTGYAELGILGAAATTFPYWPDIVQKSPLRGPVPRAGEGYVPFSVGTAIGLHGGWSLLPLYALITIIVIVLLGRDERGRWVTTASGIAVAALVVAALGLAPRTTDRDARWRCLDQIWEPRPRS